MGTTHSILSLVQPLEFELSAPCSRQPTKFSKQKDEPAHPRASMPTRAENQSTHLTLCATTVDSICGRGRPLSSNASPVAARKRAPEDEHTDAFFKKISHRPSISTLILPSPRFDLDEIHPPSPPYLGASLLIPSISGLENERRDNSASNGRPTVTQRTGATSFNASLPPPPLPSPPRLRKCENESRALFNASLGLARTDSLDLSVTSASSDEDIPREVDLLDTPPSVCRNSTGLRGDFIADEDHDSLGNFTPRRGDDDCLQDFNGNQSSQAAIGFSETKSPTPDPVDETQILIATDICGPYSDLCLSRSSANSTQGNESLVIQNGVLIKGTIPTPVSRQPESPTKGACHRSGKRVNTLPSMIRGRPIRLKITESYSGCSPYLMSPTSDTEDFGDRRWQSLISAMATDEYADHFSYDPYFSSGAYNVTTTNDHPFGNGLTVKMGTQYMTLHDGDGRVFAVTRSRHTFIPSHVIYSPKPRYTSQSPSTHCPKADDLTGGMHTSKAHHVVQLYPWALVKKEGRRMDHDVTIHMVQDSKKCSDAPGSVGGIFQPTPSFRSRHGFDGHENHTHTVVTRVVTESESKTFEIPCCLIIRDTIRRDVSNVTVAPGIDPLLIICYIAVHAKMDVEPKLDHE